MLKDMAALATIAVKDLGVAGKFYGETLGLKRLPGGEEEVLTFESGGSKILVYRSQYAGTNQATAATWVIEDGLEEIVRDLGAKGVAFEHYDMPGMTREGDIHVAGNLRNAWLKDPDGNILSLVSETK
ncbi:MAG: VOC family protein [Acidobacteriota bacterium]